jgi:hypothetical protein
MYPDPLIFIIYMLDNIKHCQDIRLKCIPDVYCPKKFEKKSWQNFQQKMLNVIFVKVFLQIYSIYQVQLVIYTHKRCTKILTT